MLLTNTQFVLLPIVDTYLWANVADTDNRYDYLVQQYNYVMFMCTKAGWAGPVHKAVLHTHCCIVISTDGHSSILATCRCAKERGEKEVGYPGDQETPVCCVWGRCVWLCRGRSVCVISSILQYSPVIL